MWNATNTTTEETAGVRSRYITLVTSLTVVGVLTLSANMVLIITLVRFISTHLKQSTRLFLVYKCLGHACHGICMIVKPYLLKHQCVHFGRFSRTVLGMVVGGMFLLSLDSFITISKPYTHKCIMTPRMAKLSVFLFSMFVISLLLISALVPGPLPHESSKICTQNNSQVNPWVLIAIILIGVLLMFMAMGLQGYNIWTLRKRLNNAAPASMIAFVPNAVEPMGAQPQNTSNNNTVTRLGRLQRLLTVWVISIFVCWMPTCIMITLKAIIDIYHIKIPVLALVQPQLSVLTLVDGLLQPCLAVALSHEIRSGVRKLFCCAKVTAGNNGQVLNGGGTVEVVMHAASHI